MRSLDEIALTYVTDKRASAHNYLEKYERYFGPRRDYAKIVLEIGVKFGKSIEVWKEYFTEAHIVGIDIDPKCKRHEGVRKSVYIGNQSDLSFLKSVMDDTGAPDIIIDDGSHKGKDILASWQFLWNFLKPGGIYIIEDISTSYNWPNNTDFSDVLPGILQGLLSRKDCTIFSMEMFFNLLIIRKK